jgi:putative FmdB family regulatory protein
MVYWGGVYRKRIKKMPLYEYTCLDCGETFDKIVSFSEADKLPLCPSCGEKNTQKKISAGAFLGATSRESGTSLASPPPSRFT